MRTETVGQTPRVEESAGSQVGMAPLAALRLALWRVGRSFGLLLAVGLGMVVAVVLICTVPLYSSLVSNVQVQQQLSIQAPSDLNIESVATLHPFTSSSVGAILNQTESYASQLLSPFAPTSTWYLRIENENSFPPVAINHQQLPNPSYPLPPDPVLQPYVFNYQQALPHMDILSGRLPESTAAGQMPEILATKNLGLKPGDTIAIGYRKLTFKVVGVWVPKSVSDPYWNGNGSNFNFTLPPCYGACSPTLLPVLFAQSTFFAVFGSGQTTSAPEPLTVSVHYISFTIPTRIAVANIPQIITAISTYRSTLNGGLYIVSGVTGIGIGTQLDSVLGTLRQQFGLLTQPLYIIVVQLVVVALLFVVAMASLLVENQTTDIATLKSRGASSAQLLLNYTLQGLVVALLAVLAGPFLAVGMSLIIVRFFIPDSARILQQLVGSSGGIGAQIASPQLVLEPAVAGALLGLLALLLAAWTAGRRDVLALRREAGRQQRAPFWQRTYLDVGLVLLALAGYVELGEFGGLDIRQQLGQSASGGADLLQLAAPALLLLAGALVALRLFPLATRMGAWLAQRGRGAVRMLAFAELARAAGQFARLALLLSLSIGLGIFALTFQASLQTNTLAEAGFLVGCDQRVVLQSPVQGTPPTAPFKAQIAAMPGVEAITPVYRSLATNTSDGTNVDLLGIDPASFAKVAYWRSNYASAPLATLLSRMQAHAQGPLAGEPSHPIWALIDPEFASSYRLAPGVVFTLTPQDSSSASLAFRVEAVVDHFPTLGDSSVSGQVVFNLADYVHALNGPQGAGGYINYIGPNEYWLRTANSAVDAADRAVDLRNPNLWVQTVISRATLEQQALDNPLSSGMTGLLVIGAAGAALLAILGSVIQASVLARKRLTQFAILRTLGGQRQQLVGILLTQQLVVYGFGLVVGTLLGIVLATATLPFLQFSTTALNTATQQLPPYVLSLNGEAIAGFYVALLAAFGLALFVSLQAATRGGLGQTLRLGED